MILFLFFTKTCCGYSLEVPSNVYPQYVFWRDKKKVIFGYPLLSGAMFTVYTHDSWVCKMSKQTVQVLAMFADTQVTIITKLQ